MVNFKKIRFAIYICLLTMMCINIVLAVMGVNNTLYLAINFPLLGVPLLFGLSIKNKQLAFARKKMLAKEDVDFKFLENKVGYKIVVETLMREFQGILIEVDGAWIKIKDMGMGNKIHLLRSNMITFIIIK